MHNGPDATLSHAGHMMEFVCEEDTIGPSSIQGSVGGDGAHRQHSHGDNDVGHHEHADGLVQSSLSHHETWRDKTKSNQPPKDLIGKWTLSEKSLQCLGGCKSYIFKDKHTINHIITGVSV